SSPRVHTHTRLPLSLPKGIRVKETKDRLKIRIGGTISLSENRVGENRLPVEKTRWQILVVVEKSASGAPVHMNGRVYDFELARFISADPYVQDATDAQAYNRYSYVSNNPLTHIDPSGFISFKDVLKIVAVVVVGILTAGAATALYTGWSFSSTLGFVLSGSFVGAGAVVAGIGFGFGAAFAGALLSGASFGDALKAGAIGGITGGITAGLASGIGNMKHAGTTLKAAKLSENPIAYLMHKAAHGVVGGAVSASQGGEFKHGFVSSAVGKTGGGMLNGALSGLEKQARTIWGTVGTAILGGTVSELGGGKFANGAATAAVQHLFNEASRNAAGRAKKAAGIVNDADNWFKNAKTVGKMFFEWDLGFGPDNRSFVNDSVADAMRNAWRVGEAREYFYDKYSGQSIQAGFSVTNFKGSFGIQGLVRAGIDPVEQFVGSYRVDVIALNANTLQFTLTNTTSFESFFYGIGPEWERSAFRFNGNTRQEYIFTEKVR
ncbi:hypothetical protein MLD52_22620, partial [Puniceicoccaceae bacterium K14]|nr:hypothetical protein [Puniceicoccaceae bacterium K14]